MQTEMLLGGSPYLRSGNKQMVAVIEIKALGSEIKAKPLA